MNVDEGMFMYGCGVCGGGKAQMDRSWPVNEGE